MSKIEDDLRAELKELDQRCHELGNQVMREQAQHYKFEKIIKDTIWMARRYASGRSTYAPSMFNVALDAALKLGMKIDDDNTIGRYAKDGMFGEWIEGVGFEKLK